MSPPAAAAAEAWELQEELWEEIFLHLPPDDPASFLRASLVCKTWRRIVSRPGFLRCLGELHRAPPILGFFRNGRNEDGFSFVPTTASAFSLPIPIPIPERRSWGVVDCRHGRVLLRSRRSVREFLVWEPMTGYQRRLPDLFVESKYDIREHTLVALAIGEDVSDLRGSRLTQAEDGELRFVNVYDTILWLCPWDEDRGWVDTRLIRLKDVLPPVATAASTEFPVAAAASTDLPVAAAASTDLPCEANPVQDVVGFVEGASIIFLSTNDGIYTIDPNSAGQARKVCSMPLDYTWGPFDSALFPFTSFYIPPGGQHDARE